MKRDLSALEAHIFDVVVVGGGIFGAAAAWEAASRGLSVALLERDDFAQATSNNHFRMIHGGIRYLQHGDVPRVIESSRERSAMLRIAPHLVTPLPIAIPTYGHGMKGKEILRIGTTLYDVLTNGRNAGIPDETRRIPGAYGLSKAETLEMFPGLPQAGLTGAIVFRDGQVYHPARLVLAFLQSAGQAGAVVANYVEVTGFLQKDGAVSGVKACDRLSGGLLEVRGRVVVNAAGPWAAHLLEGQPGLRSLAPTFSRDACFVVNRRLLGPASQDHALTVLGNTSDPDALLSRGRRALFMVPWQENTLVGVWHVVYTGDPDRLTVSEADLQSFLDEINQAYPALGLKLSDVSRWMAGLTLFGDNAEGQKNLSYGKRSQLIDHRQTNGVDGLITMIGVRYTMARGVAAKTIDLALNKLGKQPRPSETERLPLHGADFTHFSDLRQEALRRTPPGLPEPALEALLRNHGSAYRKVLDLGGSEPALSGCLPGTRVTAAEVAHAVRHEMAYTLEDVVFRRTDMGSGGYPGDKALRQAASLLSTELGWDERKVANEVEAVSMKFFGKRM